MSMNGKGTVTVPVVKDGRTKQSFKKVADINSIVARYRKTGVFDHVSRKAGVFADVSDIGDFASVAGRIRAAEEAFDRLPAIVRSRFSNDAAQLLAFIGDDKNRDEAIRLGLIEAPKEPVVEPAKPAVVTPKP